MFAAVNAVGVQIVFVDEENATAHAWRKTGDDLHRRRRLRFALGASNRSARGALREIFRRTDKSSQRAGRDDSGRTQIHVGIAIAHAALEITIGGADRDLAFLHQTATQADASAAPGRQRNGARVDQSLPITSGLRPGLHFGARRGEIKFDAVGNVSALGAHDFGGVMQILEARVHARQQIRLLNGHMFPLHFRQRHHRLHFIGPGHMRNHGRQIEFQFDGVLSVRVGADLAAILPPGVDIGVRISRATLRCRAFPDVSDS